MIDEIHTRLYELDRDVAVVVVRVDHHDTAVDELREVTRYLQRLLISTMVAVLLGGSTAVLGAFLAS